ncbi:MAG TPA: TonB-dependent receptor, partial [Balneolaceae bacterium]|nr:TonB-dependent receptor [Balneolaceae bacterium]
MKKIITACLLSIVFLLPLHSFAQNTATLKGKVTDNKGNPLTGANISLVSIQRGAVANKTGHYTIDNISPGKYTVRVSFIGYKKKQQKISFKAGQTVIRNFKLRKSAITSQGVTVIGSRASHASTTDLAVPVQRISYQEINDISGTPNTNQMLERVSPTINSPHTSNQDGTSAVQPLTVRGLSPDQTLVMIDGVRRHPTALVHRLTTGGVQEGSSGVDFGAIPSIAISDIDILKSGAAAQYGSAAIAGVINLKLKKGPIKPKIIGRYGEYTPDNWPDGGEKYNLSGQYSFSLGDRGFLNVFGQFSHREPITRAGADPRDQLQPGDGDIVDSNGNVVKKNNPVPQPDFMRGNGKSTDVYAWWNGQYSLSEESNTKLYTYGGYSHRNTLNFGFYRRALGNRDWPSIYPLGFLPQFKDPIKDASGTVGIKGTILGGWHYDLNSVLGYNRYEFHITNSMNVSYGPNIPPNQTSFYAGAEHLIESTSEFSLKK